MSEHVEFTAQYVTTVDTLPDAWAFVMGRLDSVGDRPDVHIKPIRRCDLGIPQMVDGDEGVWTDHFEVVVKGTVDEAASDD